MNVPSMVDERRDVMVVTANPMTMLSQALERGASIEVLNKLMDLQERWEINNARKEYENAVADARAEIKPIKKNRKGNYGNYADMAGIASEIDPIIASHGLSYRFRSRVEDKHVVVTCIVSHRAGHSEENSVPGPVDTSGSKNNIQSIGSTLTYLQRYTLTMALGLSFEDNDDDDDGAKGVRIARRPIRQPRTEMNDGYSFDDSPPLPPSQAADLGASSSTSTVSPGAATGGAPSLPTAAKYIERWDTLIQCATDWRPLAAEWNEQKTLRAQIEWDSREQREALNNKVAEAVQFLKG